MNRRSRLPLLIFVALLVIVPIAELWVLFKVGSTIGVLPTIAILLVEAALGGWLMKREGSATWRALNEGLAAGRMPSRELADAGLVLVGGVMLMFPGFVTDVVGFFCLLPFTRPLARKVLAFFVARRVAAVGPVGTIGGFTTGAPGYRPGSVYGDGEVIEGEVVEPEPARDRRAQEPPALP